jgi:hypothetical protein
VVSPQASAGALIWRKTEARDLIVFSSSFLGLSANFQGSLCNFYFSLDPVVLLIINAPSLLDALHPLPFKRKKWAYIVNQKKMSLPTSYLVKEKQSLAHAWSPSLVAATVGIFPIPDPAEKLPAATCGGDQATPPSVRPL